jgi:hypothetical protein
VTVTASVSGQEASLILVPYQGASYELEVVWYHSGCERSHTCAMAMTKNLHLDSAVSEGSRRFTRMLHNAKIV